VQHRLVMVCKVCT